MKKTKILLGTLSVAALTPAMSVMLTACNKGGDTAFTPTIEKDENVKSVECSPTKLNTAFSVACTVTEGYKLDVNNTTITVENKTLINEQDYIVHENIIVVGSAAVTSTKVNINIKTIDTSVTYDVKLFVNEGGTLEGGQTSLKVTQGTKWKDIDNKPTPTAKQGYKFDGWYRNETKITDETIINESMDIYAWFVKESGGQCYVTVLAGPGGVINGSSVISVQSGQKWGNIKPTYTADSGYEFDAWYMNDVKINDDTIISSNSYVFAWFKSTTGDKCKIKFECLAGGIFSGTPTTEIEITKGDTWATIKNSAPDTTPNTGYTFKAWYVNQEQTPVTDATVFNDATYVFAYFEKTDIKVTIDNTVQHCTVTQPDAIPASNFNIARETLDKQVQPDDGYALAGWEDENGRIFDNYQLSTDKTIKPIIVEEYNTYTLNADGTATISGRVSGQDQTDLMIPSYVYKENKWYKVTAIYFDASSGYYMGSSTINTLCIPNTISTIRDRAFKQCSNLKTIYIPTSVTYFGYQCFYSAPSCTSFNYLGTIAQYKKVKNGGWWHDGMKTRTTICIDGTTNIDADA